MIDYKHGTGQKRRLTLTSDATREAVAQAKGESWGSLRANSLARRVVEQTPLLAWAGWKGEAYRRGIAGVTSWLQRTPSLRWFEMLRASYSAPLTTDRYGDR